MSWQMRFPDCQTATCPQMFLPLTVSVLMLLSRVWTTAAQLLCLEVATLRANSSLHFSTQQVDGHTILGDISTGTFRPVVPQFLENKSLRPSTITSIQAGRPPNVSS